MWVCRHSINLRIPSSSSTEAVKPISAAGLFRAPNSILDEGESPRLELDSVIGSGKPDHHLAQLLDAGPFPGSHVVELVGGVRLHRADVGGAAVLDVYEVIGLTAVAINLEGLATVDSIEHLHHHRDIGSAVVLARPIHVHVPETHVRELVAVKERAGHCLARDLRRAVEVGVVERVILVHRLLDRISVDGRG